MNMFKLASPFTEDKTVVIIVICIIGLKLKQRQIILDSYVVFTTAKRRSTMKFEMVEEKPSKELIA